MGCEQGGVMYLHGGVVQSHRPELWASYLVDAHGMPYAMGCPCHVMGIKFEKDTTNL